MNPTRRSRKRESVEATARRWLRDHAGTIQLGRVSEFHIEPLIRRERRRAVRKVREVQRASIVELWKAGLHSGGKDRDQAERWASACKAILAATPRSGA